MFYRLILLIMVLTRPAVVLADPDRYAQVIAGQKQFRVAIADTPQARQKGLMGREHLASDEGLLIVMPHVQPIPIWMKNVLIELDVVWLSEDKQVQQVSTLSLCRQQSCPIYNIGVPSRYVLEVAAGQFPLKPGAQIEIIGY